MAARLWRYIEFGFLTNQNLRTGNVGHPSSKKNGACSLIGIPEQVPPQATPQVPPQVRLGFV